MRIIKKQSEAETLGRHLQELCESTIGGKWKIRVWENTGWHYSVSCGSADISEYKGGEKHYACYFSGKKGQTGGTPAHISTKLQYNQDTPKKAFDMALGSARACIEGLTEAVIDTVELTK